MADTASHPLPERTDFQEVGDAEDLFSDPAVIQEVRRRTCLREAEGSRGEQGVMLPTDNRCKLGGGEASKEKTLTLRWFKCGVKLMLY